MRSIDFDFLTRVIVHRGISVFFLLLLVLSLPQAPFGDDDDDGDQEINELAPNHSSDSQRALTFSDNHLPWRRYLCISGTNGILTRRRRTRTTTCLFLAHTVRQIIVDSIRFSINRSQPTSRCLAKDLKMPHQ